MLLLTVKLFARAIAVAGGAPDSGETKTENKNIKNRKTKPLTSSRKTDRLIQPVPRLHDFVFLSSFASSESPATLLILDSRYQSSVSSVLCLSH